MMRISLYQAIKYDDFLKARMEWIRAALGDGLLEAEIYQYLQVDKPQVDGLIAHAKKEHDE